MSVHPERPLDRAYRIEVLAESERFGIDDVLRFWGRERAVPLPEALRRVHEVLLVAVDTRTEAIAGVSSAYLQRNLQLRLDFWHERAFVAAGHRLGHAGFQLAVQTYTLLEERFVSGTDRRGSGVIVELEDDAVKQAFTLAHETWDALWLGENHKGDHVRVRYFPGALAPPPPAPPEG